jgi:hypothetical protein
LVKAEWSGVIAWVAGEGGCAGQPDWLEVLELL